MSETHEGSPGEQPTVRPADRGNEGAPTRRAACERTELARPERIGPYRILQVLGEGGMGTVHEAEQTETVTRRVAL